MSANLCESGFHSQSAAAIGSAHWRNAGARVLKGGCEAATASEGDATSCERAEPESTQSQQQLGRSLEEPTLANEPEEPCWQAEQAGRSHCVAGGQRYGSMGSKKGGDKTA